MQKELRAIYNKITELDNLKPSPETNKLFSKLVSFAVGQKKGDLNNTELSKLQKICSEAEYELEKFWAEKIIGSSISKNALKKFPYNTNYKKLTQLEWLSLLGCTKHVEHKILFIGGGPLPMTAIFLAVDHDQKVTILEKEEEAYEISKKLVKSLGLGDKIKILHEDASEFKQYGKYNCFFVAALAGLEKNIKQTIIKEIQKQAPKNSHVLARSSWGSRELLYKPLQLKQHGLNPIIEVRPHNDVVNSFYIFHI